MDKDKLAAEIDKALSTITTPIWELAAKPETRARARDVLAYRAADRILEHVADRSC